MTPSRQFVMNNENQEYRGEDWQMWLLTWTGRTGVLNFDGMPLEELGDKLGRWYEVKFSSRKRA
ncbi:MAG: hypothetical protein ACLUPL_09970 [Butyricimonas virosa]